MMVVASGVLKAALAMLQSLQVLLAILQHGIVEELLLIKAVEGQYKLFSLGKVVTNLLLHRRSVKAVSLSLCQRVRRARKISLSMLFGRKGFQLFCAAASSTMLSEGSSVSKPQIRSYLWTKG